jgi:hypothetical protein
MVYIYLLIDLGYKTAEVLLISLKSVQVGQAFKELVNHLGSYLQG